MTGKCCCSQGMWWIRCRRHKKAVASANISCFCLMIYGDVSHQGFLFDSENTNGWLIFSLLKKNNHHPLMFCLMAFSELMGGRQCLSTAVVLFTNCNTAEHSHCKTYGACMLDWHSTMPCYNLILWLYVLSPFSERGWQEKQVCHGFHLVTRFPIHPHS